MSKYKNKYRIESTRLKNWDYGSNGSYFVTICTKNMEHYFGDIVPIFPIVPIVEMQNFASLQSEQLYQHHYTQIGQITFDYWKEIPNHFPFVILDEFVIMPNHIHGIITINKKNYKKWEPNKFGPQSQNLGSIIRGFKSAVKKYSTLNKIDFQWQPRFYDTLIRDENHLYNVRQYIIKNPMKWIDKENKKKLNQLTVVQSILLIFAPIAFNLSSIL